MEPLECPNPDCLEPLTKVAYTMYGAKIFNPETGAYDESKQLGDEDMVLHCPKCDCDIGEFATEEELNRLIA